MHKTVQKRAVVQTCRRTPDLPVMDYTVCTW